MHILVVNDDGPPSYSSSPYVHSFVKSLQDAGHTVSVCLPHTQRSWIGKAHIVGQTLTPTYFRPGTELEDNGTLSERPFNDGQEEWILLDGTPASCSQIGLHHLFHDRGPIDMVVCGPNFGRNTTAVFALSSGTIGGAMEGAMSGKKSIALSFAFDSRDHDLDIITEASQLSTKLVEHFASNWPEDVHLYSINVPVKKGVSKATIVYTEMIQNRWTSGSSFEELPETEGDVDPNKEEQRIRETPDSQSSDHTQKSRDHMKFKWAPKFADVRSAVEKAGSGDGWTVLQGQVSVTPLRANFWHLPHYKGEIKLAETKSKDLEKYEIYAVVDYPDEYVQPLIVRALDKHLELPYIIKDALPYEISRNQRVLQYKAYESIDFEHGSSNPHSSLVCAYVIRKALIRKHYLSNTVASWLVKHATSILSTHFKPSVHFEVDYAEFLDDALVDAWDLHESMSRNEQSGSSSRKEWWILKPGMSDGGNGIRLFSSVQQLQDIFEAWEEGTGDETEEDDDESRPDESALRRGSDDDVEGGMISQLRHFIVQPYIDPPLLLNSFGRRKFHIRTYVLAVGALKVFVYRDMLALFAARAYNPPQCEAGVDIDLAQHLTNTCFQDEATRSSSVFRFFDLPTEDLPSDWQTQVLNQICEITGEVFEAAAREQMVHFQAIPNAFEIFGVDFLVDSDLNVWLLELNAYPDFKQTGEVLQDSVVGGLFEDVVKVAIAPYFGAPACQNGTDDMLMVNSIDLGRR